jgi:hypothetical protein
MRGGVRSDGTTSAASLSVDQLRRRRAATTTPGATIVYPQNSAPLREFLGGARSRGSFAAWCVAPSGPEEEKPDNAKVAAERNCKNFLISMPRQPARLELIVIFEKAIRLETGFWKWAALRIMGLNSWSVRLAQQSGTVSKCESYVVIHLCT